MKVIRLLICCFVLPVSVATAERKTRNVILVTIDGLRWQEVFRGADPGLVNRESGGVHELLQLPIHEELIPDDEAERRRRLMPFLWGEIARHGQIYGNRDLGSHVDVKNPAVISYPGYNEMLTGRVDPALTTNARVPNPNVTVLEWLNGREPWRDQVAVCVAWQVFPFILNLERSRIWFWMTGESAAAQLRTPGTIEIDRWAKDLPPKGRDENFDVFVFRMAMEVLEARQPRVLMIGFGEPDTWGHGRRYDHYLTSTQRCDRWIGELWQRIQSMPQYRESTTLIITTDHGRGLTPEDWIHHSRTTPESDQAWFAILGPDTPPLGERREIPPLLLGAVAATVAASLGEDFCAAYPDAAPVVQEAFGSGTQ